MAEQEEPGVIVSTQIVGDYLVNVVRKGFGTFTAVCTKLQPTERTSDATVNHGPSTDNSNKTQSNSSQLPDTGASTNVSFKTDEEMVLKVEPAENITENNENFICQNEKDEIKPDSEGEGIPANTQNISRLEKFGKNGQLLRTKCSKSECKLWFRDIASLAMHENNHNDRHYICRCAGCDVTRETKTTIYETSCRECLAEYNVEISSGNHLLPVFLSRGVFIECIDCGEISNAQLSLAEDQNASQEHPTPLFLCSKKCNIKRFSTIKGLTMHRLLTTSCSKESLQHLENTQKFKKKRLDVIRKWKCAKGKCCRRFSRKWQLLQHELCHKTDAKGCDCVGCIPPARIGLCTWNFFSLTCSKCTKKYILCFTTKCITDLRHVLMEKLTFRCKTCLQVSKGKLSKHVPTSRKSLSSPEFICRHAGCLRRQNYFHYGSILRWLEHIRSQHPSKPLECSKCDRQFVTRTLRSHHRVGGRCEDRPPIHLRLKTVVCEICGNTMSQNSLKGHLKHVHGQFDGPPKKPSQPQSYPCKQCDKVCSEASYLRRHVLRQHTEGDKMCETCGKRFATNQDLLRHCKSHTTAASCPICHKSFTQERHMKEHLAEIHSDNRKVFTCAVCGKNFQSAKGLKGHEDRH